MLIIKIQQQLKQHFKQIHIYQLVPVNNLNVIHLLIVLEKIRLQLKLVITLIHA